MPLIEEIQEDEAGPSRSGPSFGEVMRELAGRLALPEELLTSFMGGGIPEEGVETYQHGVTRTLVQIESKLRGSGWDMLEVEEQGNVMYPITRLYGEDGFTSAGIRERIDRITEHVDRTAISLYLLQNPIRNLFSNPHPSINPANSRALSRPAGGADAHLDFHDTAHQSFKLPAAWGCYNSLSWATAQLPDDMLEPKIGLILPPTLTLMDDFEPAWRGRGCRVLQTWVDRFPAEIMKRMGLDRLLLDSTIHTLSLHANPPLPHVLPLALNLISKTTQGAKRAERLSEIMEKSIVRGWTYAPPGTEGRPVLINIAHQLDLMCGVMGSGIVRWLKIIIPSLLGPLQYTPTPAVEQHFSANLTALLQIMKTIAQTGRISRWRGQIIHVCGILAVNLRDRGIDARSADTAWRSSLQAQLKEIFATLGEQCPETRKVEYPALVKTDQNVFTPLVPACT